ncbi:MAG: hypothetical protein ACREP9_23730, partial [Candidatus Dormibacteraceae bacterium]
CELVEKIDSALSEMISKAESQGASFVEISGGINVSGENVTNVTGLDASSGRAVMIQPGTIMVLHESAG